jgi:hypothetical protein
MQASADISAARDWFAELPHAVVVSILALLPLDQRVRCACVCRAAAAAVADAALWTRVDLSATSGLGTPLTPAFLRAVLARARGTLLALDVGGSLRVPPRPNSEEEEAEETAAAAREEAGLPPAVPVGATTELLLELLLESGAAATLQELRVRACDEGADRYADATESGCRNIDTALLPPAAEALLRALPALRALDTTLEVTLQDGQGIAWRQLSGEDAHKARTPLRREGVFAPLRIRSLEIMFHGNEDDEDLCATVADIGVHGAWLRALKIFRAPLHEAATLDALLDVVVSSRIAHLTLHDCAVGRTSVLSLARALRASDALIELYFDKPAHLDEHSPWHDDSWEAFGAALRAHAAFRELSLHGLAHNGQRGVDTGAGAARLLRALTGHASLRYVCMAGCKGDAPGMADAIAALIAANTPALVDLDFSDSNLRDAGVTALAGALRRSTHLRHLRMTDNHVSLACTREVLMPALRVNRSLRNFYAMSETGYGQPPDCAQAYYEAEAVVMLRERA